MSMLLRAFGAERTDTLPVSEPLLARTCTVHGGEITSHPTGFLGPRLLLHGDLSSLATFLNQWKGVSVGLSVCCQVIEQSTLSTRDSFRLGNEKMASRNHSLTSVACGEVE